MTPAQLHAALAKVHARSAAILSHRLLDDRTREQCAALYGLGLEQWDLLFLRAAAAFHAALGKEAPTDALTLTPELRALAEHRDEVKRLIQKAHHDYQASPAFTFETWARRVAIVVIIALTAYFYWREEQRKKYVPYAPYLTQPKKP